MFGICLNSLDGKDWNMIRGRYNISRNWLMNNSKCEN